MTARLRPSRASRMRLRNARAVELGLDLKLESSLDGNKVQNILLIQ